MTRVTTCDVKSYELAEHFLQDDDVSDLTPEQVNDRTLSLALAIQQAVEDWIEDEERRTEYLEALRAAKHDLDRLRPKLDAETAPAIAIDQAWRICGAIRTLEQQLGVPRTDLDWFYARYGRARRRRVGGRLPA